MCATCLADEVDITDTIERESEVPQCKDCKRYLNVAGTWVRCEQESSALLAVCLKRIRGLRKFKLVDASFIWTEEHSKRLKVRVSIEREVLSRAMLRQDAVIEFRVVNHMCEDCSRASRKQTWRCLVQIRQDVQHKRTLLWLEQLIIQRNAHADALGVSAVDNGLDVYFNHKGAAQRFVDFLKSSAPVRHKVAKKLISHNVHTNEHNFQLTHAVEVVPVCKHDLCLLPDKLAGALGGIGPLVVVARVAQTLRLVDPVTARVAELSADKYYRQPFRPLAAASAMVEMTVLDVQPAPSAGRGTGAGGRSGGGAASGGAGKKGKGKGKGRRGRSARHAEEDAITMALAARALARQQEEQQQQQQQQQQQGGAKGERAASEAGASTTADSIAISLAAELSGGAEIAAAAARLRGGGASGDGASGESHHLAHEGAGAGAGAGAGTGAGAEGDDFAHLRGTARGVLTEEVDGESVWTMATVAADRFSLAEAEVALTRDLGVNDDRYTVLTHLGELLKPGDSAQGYMLATSVEAATAAAECGVSGDLPDLVIVRKVTPKKRQRRRRFARTAEEAEAVAARDAEAAAAAAEAEVEAVEATAAEGAPESAAAATAEDAEEDAIAHVAAAGAAVTDKHGHVVL